MRRPGDGAHDDGVEEDAELLLLFGDLIRPVCEAQSAEFVFGGAGRDRVGLAARFFDLGQGVLPARADADVESGRIEADVGAHDAREFDIADLVVARVLPVDPALLDEAGLQSQVSGDRGDLTGVIGLVAADRHERVRARGEDVGDDVFEFAGLVAAEGESGVDVLALGPDPSPAEVVAQSRELVHGARPEGQRVALEICDGHGVLCSLDGVALSLMCRSLGGADLSVVCPGSHPAECNILHSGDTYNGEINRLSVADLRRQGQIT